MKKKSILMFLGLMIVGLTFTASCNDDDNKPATPAPVAGELTGKWYYSQLGTNFGGSEVFIPYPDNETDCERNYILVGADNSYEDVSFNSSTTPCEMSSEQGTYTLNDDTLVVDYGTSTYTGTIVSLTSTELRVKTLFSGTEVTVIFTK